LIGAYRAVIAVRATKDRSWLLASKGPEQGVSSAKPIARGSADPWILLEHLKKSTEERE
jgi:hypothetical protein